MRSESQDDRGTDHPAAGPVAGEGGALRAEQAPSSTPPTPAPPADEAIEKDLDALLADTQRERDEYLDLAKRTKADFENYRKRMGAEVQAASSRGKAELASQMIDAVDNLERALQAAGIDPAQEDPLAGGDKRGVDDLAHGVLLVFLGLRETLSRNGIEAIDPAGERFDPNLHEALSAQPVDGVESGTVVETMQKGYRLGEQLIRPARVVVAE